MRHENFHNAFFGISIAIAAGSPCLALPLQSLLRSAARTAQVSAGKLESRFRLRAFTNKSCPIQNGILIFSRPRAMSVVARFEWGSKRGSIWTGRVQSTSNSSAISLFISALVNRW
jgi:hypothetical protein